MPPVSLPGVCQHGAKHAPLVRHLLYRRDEKRYLKKQEERSKAREAREAAKRRAEEENAGLR
jgi:hypothetical protein